jgi:hypothetical protein
MDCPGDDYCFLRADDLVAKSPLFFFDSRERDRGRPARAAARGRARALCPPAVVG